MSRSSLTLRLQAAEGALQRMLGTIERRGFRILTCNAEDADGEYRVRLSVEGSRDPGLLCRQLARLLDVHEAQHGG
jgi:acetolactate synthase regulatory subunit